MGASMALAGYKVTVAAGQEVQIQVRGSSARAIAATADFRLGVDADASVPFAGGLAFTMPQGREFEQLRIGNPTGAAITVELLVSSGEVHDARSIFAGTMPVTWSGANPVTISGTPSVSISGTPNVNATISGTPNVNATISGTPNVNATISGTPNVNATISGTPTVDGRDRPNAHATVLTSGTTWVQMIAPGSNATGLIVYSVHLPGSDSNHVIAMATSAPTNGDTGSGIAIAKGGTNVSPHAAMCCFVPSGYGIWANAAGGRCSISYRAQ